MYSFIVRVGRSGDRIPAQAIYATPVYADPKAHPASCATGTGSVSEGKARQVTSTNHPPPSAEVKERVELNFYSSLTLLNAQLNPIWHSLALLAAHHILHISKIWATFIVFSTVNLTPT